LCHETEVEGYGISDRNKQKNRTKTEGERGKKANRSGLDLTWKVKKASDGGSKKKKKK